MTPPPVLLPYQAEAIRRSHAASLFVVEKSRRTGFTWAFASDAVLTAADRAGMDVLYIGYALDMTREFIDAAGEFLRAFDLAASPGEFTFDDGSTEGVKAFRIDFPSGHKIEALTSRPRSLRGKQGLVIIDEAAFHDDLDELLKAALALTMWGGRLVVISTHNGADNPFATLIEDIRQGKRAGEVMRVTLADALAAGLYQRICLKLGREWSPQAEAAWEAELRRTYGEAAEEELDVIPARGSGTYLTRAAILGCMTPAHRVLRLRAPDDLIDRGAARALDFVAEFLDEEVRPALAALDPQRLSFAGQDFARSSDLTVLAIGQLDPLLNLQVPLIVELRNLPFREQEWLLGEILARLPLFAAARLDATGNGAQLAEGLARRFGASRVQAVRITQQTYLAGFPALKGRIEARSITLPQDEGVLDDLRLVRLVRGVPMVVDRTPDHADAGRGRRHGDAAIALMMLAVAAQSEFAPIEFRAGGRPRPSAAERELTPAGFGTVARNLELTGW